MSFQSNSIWAVVSLKPNQIHKAEINLQRQDIDFFAPKIKVTKRQHNRFVNKINLLFPGYIFVHINLATDDEQKVQSTWGVSRILKVGGRIARLPDDFVKALKCTKLDTTRTYGHDLKPGDNVEIMRGPFAGLIAKIDEMESANRVKCLFNLIEGKISVSIHNKDIVFLT